MSNSVPWRLPDRVDQRIGGWLGAHEALQSEEVAAAEVGGHGSPMAPGQEPWPGPPGARGG
ncbi:hypothetical protein ACFPYM_14420, partial [Methylobacterium hispanicum]